MKNPLVLLTEGNQQTAFNRDMIMAVRNQGAGRNAKIVLVNGLQYEVLHTYEYVMEALRDDVGSADQQPAAIRAALQNDAVPPARSPLRNR